jgi:hypothetical protein
MGQGLQVFNASGGLTFDSENVSGGMCVGIVLIPVGGAVYTFPSFAGRTAFAMAADGYKGLQWTVDYPGYPRLNFQAQSRATRVAMFVI